MTNRIEGASTGEEWAEWQKKIKTWQYVDKMILRNTATIQPMWSHLWDFLILDGFEGNFFVETLDLHPPLRETPEGYVLSRFYFSDVRALLNFKLHCG